MHINIPFGIPWKSEKESSGLRELLFLQLIAAQYYLFDGFFELSVVVTILRNDPTSLLVLNLQAEVLSGLLNLVLTYEPPLHA